MIRGTFAWDVTFPNAPVTWSFQFVSGLPKTTRLKALKNSARNCTVTDSLIFVSLINDKFSL
jgi:hypothetical protein